MAAALSGHHGEPMFLLRLACEMAPRGPGTLPNTQVGDDGC
jgi:hypothetical protein